MSNLTIAKLKPEITAKYPIKVYIDNQLVWDTTYDALTIYNEVLSSSKIVKEISYEFIDSRHSIARIVTKGVQ